MERLNKLFKECMKLMKDKNYPISEDIHSQLGMINAKHTLGLCKHRKEFVVKRGFYTKNYIYINKAFLTVEDELAIKSVLMHELIHTIRNCDNHGRMFKFYAKKANEDFGVKISTKASDLECEAFDKGQKDLGIVPKYEVVCMECGQVTPFYRKNKLCNYLLNDIPNEYYCSKCGNKHAHPFAIISINGKKIKPKISANADKKIVQKFISKLAEKSEAKKMKQLTLF